MTDTEFPQQSPDQAVLIARVRRMMLIAGMTTAVAVGAVFIAIGYRFYHGGGSTTAATTDVTAMLPRGAKVTATAVAGDELLITLDIGGATEIRTFDARTLKPLGRLKFANEP